MSKFHRHQNTQHTTVSMKTTVKTSTDTPFATEAPESDQSETKFAPGGRGALYYVRQLRDTFLKVTFNTTIDKSDDSEETHSKITVTLSPSDAAVFLMLAVFTGASAIIHVVSRWLDEQLTIRGNRRRNLSASANFNNGVYQEHPQRRLLFITSEQLTVIELLKTHPPLERIHQEIIGEPNHDGTCYFDV